MSRYHGLKMSKEITVRKEVFVPGTFTCAKGTYVHSDGLLKVQVINVSSQGADIIIGPTENEEFRVNKETALVLSEFFKELSDTLD
jgi:hypothetical protein